MSHQPGRPRLPRTVTTLPGRPKALALALLLALAIPAAPALAQQPTAAAAKKSYAIGPGTLEDVLTRFAAAAGIPLSFEPALVANRMSGGINGTYSGEDGLRLLLQGSGLAAQPRGDGSYTLVKAPQAQAPRAQAPNAEAVLPVVQVSASAQRTETTEGTGSYTTGRMRSATKLPLSIRETPQSVTVITRERLETENIVDLIDVVDTTPGLVVSYSGARPFFQARGFAIDRITQDGISSIHDDYIPSSLGNMAMQDRVEVVRGATGLMQGAGNPSAAINMIRKRPTAQFQADASVSVGSWNDHRVTADISSPLTADGRIRGRAVGFFQDAENFRDIEEDDNALGYATIDIDLTDRTTLNIGYSHLDIHSNFVWGGIPLAYDGGKLDVPRSTFVGTDWEFIDNKVNTVYASLDHDFGSGWALKANAVYVDANTELLATAVAPTQDVGGYGHVWWAIDKDREQKAIDVYVSGPVQLFGRTHELVLGGAMNHEKSDFAEWFEIWEPTQTSGVDFRAWNHSAPRPDTSPDSPFRFEYAAHSKQDSVYATGRFSIADPLKLILGGRLDWYDRTALWGGDSFGVDAHLTKYAGILYDVTPNHTAYLSYTDVFQPQSQRGSDGGFLDPIVGENYEIGLKGEYFEGALNAGVALFRLDQTNRARLLVDQGGCPLFPAESCYSAAGLVRSTGIDAELQGAITRDWQVAAGLTWSRAEYRKDADPANIGKRFNTLVPATQFKLSTDYRLPGALNRWKLGGRYTWQSRIYADATAADDTPVRNQQDAYGLLDLSVTYAPTDRLTLQLTVNNVFDKTYYRNLAGEWGSFFYSASGIFGEPRNFLATARYRF